jgi:hypothetical protein
MRTLYTSTLLCLFLLATPTFAAGLVAGSSQGAGCEAVYQIYYSEFGWDNLASCDDGGGIWNDWDGWAIDFEQTAYLDFTMAMSGQTSAFTADGYSMSGSIDLTGELPTSQTRLQMGSFPGRGLWDQRIISVTESTTIAVDLDYSNLRGNVELDFWIDGAEYYSVIGNTSETLQGSERILIDLAPGEYYFLMEMSSEFNSTIGGPIDWGADANFAVSVVPIPAAAWLFGSALAGLGWFRRKTA